MNKYRKAKKAYSIGNYYYHRKKNYEKALVNYARSMKKKTRFSSSEKILFLIGDCYWCLGKYEQALTYANKSLELSAGCLEAMNLKGVILRKIGKTKESEEILKKHDEILEKIKKEELDLDAFYNKK